MRWLALLALIGCHATPPPEKPAEHATDATDAAVAPAKYDVYDGDILVMNIVDEPGPLVSAAPPPPPPSRVEPMKHPFLTGVSVSGMHEGKIAPLLSQSKSTAEFLDKLRAAGFRIERR